MIFIGLHQGLGQHYLLLQGDFAMLGRNIFTEEILYFLVVGLGKLSMLAFYWRLFRDSIRIPCYILGILISCWQIAVVGRLLDPPLMLR